MQRTTRQSIADFVERGRRRRIWKRVTAVLSVIVLLSTAIGLRDVAIAVTESNAQEAAMEEAVLAALSTAAAPEEEAVIEATQMMPLSVDEDEELPIDIVDEIPEVAAAPAEAGPDIEVAAPVGAEPVSEVAAPAETGQVSEMAELVEAPEEASAVISGEASVIPSGSEEPSDEDAPVSASGDSVPDPLTSDIEALSEEELLNIEDEPVALAASMLAAPMATRTEAANLESARPTYLRVTDESGNTVSRTSVGEPLVVTLGWEVADLSEVQVAGDYIDISLPKELTFPEGTGYYVLNQRFDMPSGEVLWPGQNVAIYTLKDHNLHIEYTLTAVYLNQIGQLLPGLNVGSKEWMALRVEGVTATQSGTIQPAITLNGSSASTPQQIVVLERTGGRMEGVRLTSLTVLDGSGQPLTENPRTYDTISLQIQWERASASPYITTGDYYEIELPSQLTYTTFDRIVTDSNGNTVRMVLHQDAQGRWILRSTYEQIHAGYNILQGTATVNAQIPGDLNIGSDGTTTIELKAGVVNGNSTATTNLTVRGVTLPVMGNGAPYWAPTIPDYIVPKETFQMAVGRNYGVGALTMAEFSLYMMADASKAPKYNEWSLVPYDHDTSRISYDPNGNGNWWAAYCLDMSNRRIPNSGNYGPYDYYMYTIADAQKYVSGNSGATTSYFTATEQQIVNNILSTAYPFISLEEMAANLGESSITADEAIAAAQYALWSNVGGWISLSDLTGAGDVEKVKRMASKMASYTGASVGDPGYSFAFTKEPTLTYNTDDRGYGSVQVNGTVGTTNPNVLKDLKATFEAGGLSSPITFRDDGSFTCTLVGTASNPISPYTTKATVTIDGSYSYVETYVFFNYDGTQPAVSARVIKRPVHLEWEYNRTKERKIKIIKEWQDADGNLMTELPDREVTITIYRNGEVYKTVVLNKTNGFTYEEVLQELYDRYGQLYEYTVDETTDIEGYTFAGVIPSAEDDGDTFVFTAVNIEDQPETTQVTIIKDWQGLPDDRKPKYTAVAGLFFRIDNGRNNGLGYKNQVLIKDRTDTMEDGTLVVTGDYRLITDPIPAPETDGYRYATVELNASNKYTATFKDLPKFDENGKQIQYLIRELQVFDENGEDVTDEFLITYDPATSQHTFGDGNHYSFPDMDADEPTVTITNTKRGGLLVEKKWVNADGTEDWSEIVPNGIWVQLSATKNGTPISDAQLQQILGTSTRVLLNEANDWKYSWSYLPVTGMKYYVSEIIAPNQGNAYYYVRLNEDGTTTEIQTNFDGQTQADFVEVTKDDSGAYYICLVNKRKPVEIELIKEDKDTGKTLEGATFRLYDGSGHEIPNPADQEGLYRTDANGVVEVGSTEGQHLMISQIEKGRAEGDETKYLHRYVLIEKDAPEGYIPRNNPLTITFHIEIRNGHPSLVIDELDAESAADNLVVKDSGSTLKLRVKNQMIYYSLPETGSIGTKGYMTGGALLMSMAVLLYINLFMEKRRRRASK